MKEYIKLDFTAPIDWDGEKAAYQTKALTHSQVKELYECRFDERSLVNSRNNPQSMLYKAKKFEDM